MIHSQECLDAQRKQKEWDAKYPEACTKCYGTGFITVPGDWVPYGSTSAQLPSTDEPCVCEEKNLCPRCGAERVWHDEGNPAGDDLSGYHEDCPSCGYKCIACGLGSYDQARPVYECYCWEKELDEQEWS